MKTLYLDCGMGAAGDMLTAALLGLLPEEEQTAFVRNFNQLGIPNVVMEVHPAEKCGINGTSVSILIGGEEEGTDLHEKMHAHEDGHAHTHEHTHEDGYTHTHEHTHEDGHTHTHEHTHEDGHTHSHSGLSDIEHIVRDHLKLPDEVRDDILAVYGFIAEAESAAHGVPVSEIHFHEVGTLDAIADVTAVCLLMHRIHPDRVIASPLNTGSGTVRCAHGILPVPAPATAYILKGIPSYSNGIQSELLTPTGAALIRHFTENFGPMPVMSVSRIGYGMGKKDFEAANCIRAMLGDTDAAASSEIKDADRTVSRVLELACNIDDMTGEEIGFAMEQLLENGALDVWTEAIGMKKLRPGVKFCCLIRAEERERFYKLIFRYTTTAGIRISEKERILLTRQYEDVETPYGVIRKKTIEGYGVRHTKYEYEDLARIARVHGKGLLALKEEILD